MAAAAAVATARRNARKATTRVPTPAPPGQRQWSAATAAGNAPVPWSVQFHSPHGDLLTLSYEFVTPEKAEALLNANEGNRLQSDRLIEAYVRSALAKDWYFTADPVQEGPEGELFNGQHRMEMIRQSGIGQWMIVVSGLPEQARQYFDIGRKRSATDMLRMQGFKAPQALASTARMTLAWEHWRHHQSAIAPGVNEVTEYAADNEPKIREAWAVAVQISTTVDGGVSVPALAAAYLRAREVVTDPFVVANFFDRIAHNSGLTRGEPAWSLHNRLVHADKMRDVETLWWTVTLWNREMEGRGTGKLQMPKDGISAPQMPDMLAPVKEDVSPEREEALRKLEQMAKNKLARA